MLNLARFWSKTAADGRSIEPEQGNWCGQTTYWTQTCRLQPLSKGSFKISRYMIQLPHIHSMANVATRSHLAQIRRHRLVIAEIDVQYARNPPPVRGVRCHGRVGEPPRRHCWRRSRCRRESGRHYP